MKKPLLTTLFEAAIVAIGFAFFAGLLPAMILGVL